MDTIYALATARGKAGLAVVRLSGPLARTAAGRFMSSVPNVRGVRQIRDRQGNLLDEALVLNFPAGKSFTGDEVIELHLHGSPAVVDVVLRVLGDDPDLRMAEAGEFTRRALEAGRLDLAQVEGLADVIDAETEAQHRQAMRVFSGALGDLADLWRARLIRAAALVEATIDFADEDVPVDVFPEVFVLLSQVADEMRTEANGAQIAERIRSGFEVAIVGAPNVGKSTLLNRLAGRDAAITSEVAGTTRDVIEVRMDMDGLPVTLLDTAGLRDSADIVESIGIERARSRARDADLRIYMLLPGEKPALDLVQGDLIVGAKADLYPFDGIGISGRTGDGLDDLIRAVSAELGRRTATAGVAMRERHRVALLRGVSYLEVAIRGMEDGLPADLLAEELRSAIRAVDSLVGRVDVEAVLGEIFASFCIGK